MEVADALSFGKKMKLGTKISALLFIVLTGFLMLTFIGVNLLTDVKIGGKNYTKIKKLKDSLASGLLLDADVRKLRAEEVNLAEGADNARISQVEATIKNLSNEINSEFANISSLSEKERFKAVVLDSQGKWSDYSHTVSNEMLPALQKGDRTQAKALSMGAQETRYDKLSGQMGEMIQAVKSEIASMEGSIESEVRKKVMTSLFLSAAVILIVLFSVWYILRGINRPLQKEADQARSIADGDLTGDIGFETGYEMGELAGSLNAITHNFRSLLEKNRNALKELTRISNIIAETSRRVVKASETKERRISETSAAIMEINASVKGVAHGVDSLSLSASENSSSILEMAASVEEVALNVENLAQTVEDVSSSIVEMAASIRQIGNGVQSLIETSSVTASSVMEMDSAIRQVEKNATDTSIISEEVRRDAEMGRASVEATINGMQEIKRSSGITSEVIVTLSEKANDIGAILSVIDEVAEQTNLLALNAAIIAAQAGEQGKGFAVVADEIKELADRTSSSTREIAMLIKGVQEETRRAVEAINQAEKSIADGERLSEKSGEALNKIVEGVKRATEQIGEIANAAVEQAKGSQMIRSAVEQVNDMIMQISNATQEQSKGSELIMTAVERMKVLTGQVRSSTREQSKVGTLIAQSTENITNMIQQIKGACDEQAKGSEQIVYATEDIQRSTDENIEAVSVLDDAFAGLSRQIEALDKEVRRFRINA